MALPPPLRGIAIVVMWVATVLLHVEASLWLATVPGWMVELDPAPITAGVFTAPRDPSLDGIGRGLTAAWLVAPLLWFGVWWMALSRLGRPTRPPWRWLQVWGALLTAGGCIGALTYRGAPSVGRAGIDLLWFTGTYGLLALGWMGLTGLAVAFRHGFAGEPAQT
jgi:hypothetical protein